MSVEPECRVCKTTGTTCHRCFEARLAKLDLPPDNPRCGNCGYPLIRSGNCWTCLYDGSSSGCD